MLFTSEITTAPYSETMLHKKTLINNSMNSKDQPTIFMKNEHVPIWQFWIRERSNHLIGIFIFQRLSPVDENTPSQDKISTFTSPSKNKSRIKSSHYNYIKFSPSYLMVLLNSVYRIWCNTLWLWLILQLFAIAQMVTCQFQKSQSLACQFRKCRSSRVNFGWKNTDLSISEGFSAKSLAFIKA